MYELATTDQTVLADIDSGFNIQCVRFPPTFSSFADLHLPNHGTVSAAAVHSYAGTQVGPVPH
jgi:hypothetical protein